MLSIRGNATELLRTRAEQLIRGIGGLNTSVQTAIDDPNIRLMVLVDAVDGDRNQNTRVSWAAPDTQISVTVEIAARGDGLYQGLLHELVLHAVPAVQRHLAAIAQHRAPVYPVGRQILVEEAQEHASQAGWLLMAELAIASGLTGLLDAAVMDACAHDKGIARAVVRSLRQRNLITQEDAADLYDEIDS
ncbi:hypothetical protein [Kitasatospora phosalacinea]|uniref:Uncharacterized protein n=1 Tax=Kitasatospora phosalacinea TaxID=2065 RepID=A0A9W6PQ74_9ACTN|nr:hypothetical protein [Kitasatospora phosalacinea]GLW58984.1 hypothetical protein Kpho01_69940 [Kitasatospora phosalacinea]